MNDQYIITENTSGIPVYQQPQTYYQMEIVKPTLDFSYIKTLSGMLKCICIILDFICLIWLYTIGPAYTGNGWINFVCVFGMLTSSTLLILYLFHIVDLYPQIPWIIAEMVFCFAWAISFFMCSCVLAITAFRFHGITGYGAISFFSFGAMCAYGFDSYLKFLAWKRDEVATGGIALNYLPYNDRILRKS